MKEEEEGRGGADESEGTAGGHDGDRDRCGGRSLGRSAEGDLLLLSGHDYSIVCLLAALRVPDYPAKTVGFGAHLVLESRRSAEGNVTVSCLLNCEPFTGSARGDGSSLTSENL